MILAGSLAAPLALSFDKKVAFYTKWKYLFPAMLIPALLYILWDMYFTYKGVWWFNEKYITGITLINLPVEEVLFFFVVPYCCVFIYECIRCYFPGFKNKKTADYLLLCIGVVLLAVGLLYYNRLYTSWTFLLNAACIAVIVVNKKRFRYFDIAAFLLAYCIILIPFLLVNGLLTAIPVVLYNDAQNLDIRITTIPIEDTFYGMLLVLLNVIIFEKLRQAK
ncbi:MAG TPA: lycopene cyclase domain-containing protein [Ferruginibacter sp.]|nr:lycopene cyclase domain-containing protein [Ferruginibacter sp.]HMP19452.1 lycopene cyclase domain-containing protein [Ferruginibacter sp.]